VWVDDESTGTNSYDDVYDGVESGVGKIVFVKDKRRPSTSASNRLSAALLLFSYFFLTQEPKLVEYEFN